LLDRQLDNEIHVKIGGDHGGGSFKMAFQILNTKAPNSRENTVVFTLFEAKDCRSNLKLALSRFKSQIDDLQQMTWSKKIAHFNPLFSEKEKKIKFRGQGQNL